MMHVGVFHRTTQFLGGDDYGSREGGNLWFDPLISQHDAFTDTLRKNHAALVGPLLPQNMPGFQAHGKYKTAADPIDTNTHHFLIGASLGLPPWQSLSIYPSIIEIRQPTERKASYPVIHLSNSDFSDAEFTSTRLP